MSDFVGMKLYALLFRIIISRILDYSKFCFRMKLEMICGISASK
jgi:hypothetical protein